MGGGSAPSGNTTTTTNNIPFNEGQLNAVQNSALNLLNNNPINYYPGQTLATPTTGGDYYSLNNLAQNAAGATINANDLGLIQNNALNENNNLASGSYLPNINNSNDALSGVMNAPSTGASQAMGTLNNLSTNNPLGGYVDELNNLSNSGAASSLNNLATGNTGNAAINQLTQAANGAYLSNENPYLAQQFQAAANPLIQAYQSATAPQTDSAFELAGRFGSGANLNANNVNETNLGNSLANLSSSLYGNAYNNALNTTENAASSLGGLESTAGNSLLGNTISGETNAGNLENSAMNTMASAATNEGNIANSAAATQANAANDWLSGYPQMLNTITNASAQTPNLTAMPFNDLSIAAGANAANDQNTQAVINDAVNRYYGNEMEPYTTLDQAASVIGGAIPGLSSTTEPYYSNSTAQGLGLGLAGLSALGGVGSLGATAGGTSAGSGLLGLLGTLFA